jgi:hypothetical protein
MRRTSAVFITALAAATITLSLWPNESAAKKNYRTAIRSATSVSPNRSRRAKSRRVKRVDRRGISIAKSLKEPGDYARLPSGTATGLVAWTIKQAPAHAREYGVFRVKGAGALDGRYVVKGGRRGVTFGEDSVFYRAIKRKGTLRVIYHNHPNGNIVPSGMDFEYDATRLYSSADVGFALRHGQRSMLIGGIVGNNRFGTVTKWRIPQVPVKVEKDRIVFKNRKNGGHQLYIDNFIKADAVAGSWRVNLARTRQTP